MARPKWRRGCQADGHSAAGCFCQKQFLLAYHAALIRQVQDRSLVVEVPHGRSTGHAREMGEQAFYNHTQLMVVAAAL